MQLPFVSDWKLLFLVVVIAALVLFFLITTLIEAKRGISPRSYNNHKGSGREREKAAEIKDKKRECGVCLNRPPDTAPLCHKMVPTGHAVKLLFIPIFR